MGSLENRSAHENVHALFGLHLNWCTKTCLCKNGSTGEQVSVVISTLENRCGRDRVRPSIPARINMEQARTDGHMNLEICRCSDLRQVCENRTIAIVEKCDWNKSNLTISRL